MPSSSITSSAAASAAARTLAAAPALPADLAGRVRPLTLAADRQLPVLPGLTGLLGAPGLRRGTTVSVGGSTALALALAAGPSAAGSWVAAAGLPGLGAVAAAGLGVDLSRLALVPDPPARHWAAAVAALVDGIDVVIVRPPARVRPADARRLVARARERGAVLIQLGDAWPEAPALSLTLTASTWFGLDDGAGHLRARRVEVTATGRGAAGGPPRRVQLWLPGPDGSVTAVDEADGAPAPWPERHLTRVPATPGAAPPVALVPPPAGVPPSAGVPPAPPVPAVVPGEAGVAAVAPAPAGSGREGRGRWPDIGTRPAAGSLEAAGPGYGRSAACGGSVVPGAGLPVEPPVASPVGAG